MTPASEKFLAEIRSDNADVRYAAWSRADEMDPEVIPELGKLLTAGQRLAAYLAHQKPKNGRGAA